MAHLAVQNLALQKTIESSRAVLRLSRVFLESKVLENEVKHMSGPRVRARPALDIHQRGVQWKGGAVDWGSTI